MSQAWKQPSKGPKTVTHGVGLTIDGAVVDWNGNQMRQEDHHANRQRSKYLQYHAHPIAIQKAAAKRLNSMQASYSLGHLGPDSHMWT